MSRATCLQQQDITPPHVFISSTFENLVAEIRDQLHNQLESFNYLPVMSELGTFSYTHGKATVVDDTISAVQACQLYVLVIGRRYGSRHARFPDRSITELEYEQAVRHNLPISVYVHSRVWQGYRAFKSGAISEGKYNHWVDELDVFGFIERVAERDGMRCVQFDNGQDIIDDFRKQIANLFGAFLRFDLKASRWLWNEWRTRSIEGTADTVWIVTPNFYWDYHDPEFRDLVFGNVVKRKVKYYYIYRDTPTNNERITEMVLDYQREIGDDWKDRVHYAGLSDDEFVWCTEQILFNPYSGPDEHGIIVDIMDARDKHNKHNIELGRDKRLDFRRQFEHLWNQKVTDPKWRIVPPVAIVSSVGVRP